MHRVGGHPRSKSLSLISNWATYYYNTGLAPFTIQYLGDDPVDDPKIYAKTSPMSYIKAASTPTDHQPTLAAAAGT